MGTSRAERRRRSEERILTAARALFAERGYERTTIRAVAAAAGVDPSLVIQYFGAKRELFARALQIPAAPSGGGSGTRPGPGPEDPRQGSVSTTAPEPAPGPRSGTGAGAEACEPGDPVEAILESLGLKLGGLPPRSLAMLRSMLTHPEAADSAREVLGRQIDRIGAGLAAPDAELRAALAISAMLGVAIGHRLLGLPALGEASRDDIARLLRPSLRALLGSAPDPETGG